METRLKAKEGSGQRIVFAERYRLLGLYRACMSNAWELLSDAEFLLDGERYARAYFVTLTAYEEFGKAQLVADFYNGCVAQSEFDRAFRSHDLKVRYLERYVAVPETPAEPWYIEYDLRCANDFRTEREKSLYVSFETDYAPLVPSESVDRSTVEKTFREVRDAYFEMVKLEFYSGLIGIKALTK